jgi:hypothetical protein
MIKYINFIFKSFIEVTAFILLFVCISLGGVLGYKSDEGHLVTGLILGLGVGIVVDTFIFGFIILLINIDNNIEELNNNIVS